jgi:hypothetical protein
LLYKKRRGLFEDDSQKTGKAKTQRNYKNKIAQRKKHKIRQTATPYKQTERSDSAILDNLVRLRRISALLSASLCGGLGI